MIWCLKPTGKAHFCNLPPTLKTPFTTIGHSLRKGCKNELLFNSYFVFKRKSSSKFVCFGKHFKASPKLRRCTSCMMATQLGRVLQHTRTSERNICFWNKTKRSSHATARFSLDQFEYRVNSSCSKLFSSCPNPVLVDAHSALLSFTFRSVALFTTGNSNGTGQVSSFCQIKSGPLNHKFA